MVDGERKRPAGLFVSAADAEPLEADAHRLESLDVDVLDRLRIEAPTLGDLGHGVALEVKRVEQLHINFANVPRDQFEGLQAYRSSHFSSSDPSLNAKDYGISFSFFLLPQYGSRPVLPQYRTETQQVSPVWERVFEIFGLKRNAIRQGKLLLAVTLSTSGELRKQRVP